MEGLGHHLARLRTSWRAARRRAGKWLLGALGAVVVAVLATEISGVIDLQEMLKSEDERPSLVAQRREVVLDAAKDGLDLVQERDLWLKPGGGKSWLVQFSSPPFRSDELRIYDYVAGELVLDYRFAPLITLRPDGPEYPVSIRMETIKDYNHDDRPDLVGGLGGPRNANDFPIRPFLLHYNPRRRTFDAFPMRGDHLVSLASKTYRLPNGRLIRKGTEINFHFARPAFIRDRPGSLGGMYEGVFEFIVGYSERLHSAVAVVAYAPQLASSRRFWRWETGAFGLDWSGARPGSVDCLLSLDQQVVEGQSLYLTDVRRELRKRLPYVSPPCI